MKKTLDQVNPAGRIDVLAFKVLERIAATQAPQEWPVLAPFVEKACREFLGPKGKLWR